MLEKGTRNARIWSMGTKYSVAPNRFAVRFLEI